MILIILLNTQIDHFAIVVPPGSKTAGEPFEVIIEARDGEDNIVDWTGSIYCSWAIIPPGDIEAPSKIIIGGGRWKGKITIYRADPEIRIVACGDTSEPFSVLPGDPARLQILLSGELPVRGRRNTPGKSGKPISQMICHPCSTFVYHTDEWFNTVSEEIDAKFTSTDKYFKPDTFWVFRGGDTVCVNFRQAGCPFPDEGYALHTIRIEALNIRPDSSGVPVVPDTVVNKILFICPGDTPEPGADDGVTENSRAKVFAFKPCTLTIYGTDKTWNEPESKYFPSDVEVWLEAFPPRGVDFHYGLLGDTTKKREILKFGGTKFLALVTTTTPGPGESRFLITAKATGFESYSKDLFWETIPDTAVIKPEYGNFPNPAKGEVTIRFEVPPHTEVNIKIYNANGELVRRFAGVKNKSSLHIGYTLIWKGRDDKGKILPSGIYFYKLNNNRINKIVFLR